jgi:hypothetical protein
MYLFFDNKEVSISKINFHFGLQKIIPLWYLCLELRSKICSILTNI